MPLRVATPDEVLGPQVRHPSASPFHCQEKLLLPSGEHLDADGAFSHGNTSEALCCGLPTPNVKITPRDQ